MIVVVGQPRTGFGPPGSYKCDANAMDSLITAAAGVLAMGDPLGALNGVLRCEREFFTAGY